MIAGALVGFLAGIAVTLCLQGPRTELVCLHLHYAGPIKTQPEPEPSPEKVEP